MSTLSMTTTQMAARDVDGIALGRLYLLRSGYLLGAVGLGNIMVPAFLHHGPWTVAQGVKNAMLLALVVCWVLGLRYPLKMLPLLFFEMTWKAIWLLSVAWPLWAMHQLEGPVLETAHACLLGIIVPLLLPWRFVIANYVRAPGDRWK